MTARDRQLAQLARDVASGRIQVASTSDDATVVLPSGEVVHSFQSRQRAIVLLVGREFFDADGKAKPGCESEVRDRIADAVTEAMR